jgi:hypothetical protein
MKTPSVLALSDMVKNDINVLLHVVHYRIADEVQSASAVSVHENGTSVLLKEVAKPLKMYCLSHSLACSNKLRLHGRAGHNSHSLGLS